MIRIIRTVALIALYFILHEVHAQNQEAAHKKKPFGFRRLDDTVTVEKNGLFILHLIPDGLLEEQVFIILK
jgi:hypothetical protein